MSDTALKHPARELLARYGAILRAAWQARHELAGPSRLADEIAFLPAALSLQETPVHPAPRRLAWAIMALFVLALVWSIVGKIDIVAVASGRIVVSDRTKLIQPLQTSVVRRIMVKDGDRVHEGQVLVELDPTIASADKASVREQLSSTVSEALRTAALLKGLDGGRVPTLDDSHADATMRAQLSAEWQDITAKLARLDAEAARRRAEVGTVLESIAKLEATVPMARAREADFRKLVDQGYISGHATQDKTRERIELERDLATLRARLIEAQSALSESQQSKAAYLAETRRTLYDRHAQANSRRQQLAQEDTKASQRERLTQLTAPVTGMVQQLAVHTAGGVVTEAQPLMVIVPEEAQVTAEVTLDNKDVGFVNAGQGAEIKLETFPYTRYGTVPATVHRVTADAVNDEKRGAVFPVTLALGQHQIAVDGRPIHLSPGMNVTAEIKTGQRRVIEYLLSPIRRTGNESFGER
ncbi:HlyD family type I secretion periplasmic adaptor subunit [Ramlibacter sp. 2FC]|uniref:HlyD family type I secretion periplasmic adaptor subunit n=1 Tax=Ramlibacter sp. 2FC TaxID=2502188 RepID=UPI0010F65422|nr:HlyD family type I secretion periplasmic adaptor subunit [Ramlibacter sp. 2FC]